MKMTVSQASLLCMIILTGLTWFGIKAYRAGKNCGYTRTAEAGTAMTVVSVISVIILAIRTVVGII